MSSSAVVLSRYSDRHHTVEESQPYMVSAGRFVVDDGSLVFQPDENVVATNDAYSGETEKWVIRVNGQLIPGTEPIVLNEGDSIFTHTKGDEWAESFEVESISTKDPFTDIFRRFAKQIEEKFGQPYFISYQPGEKPVFQIQIKRRSIPFYSPDPKNKKWMRQLQGIATDNVICADFDHHIADWEVAIKEVAYDEPVVQIDIKLTTFPKIQFIGQINDNIRRRVKRLLFELDRSLDGIRDVQVIGTPDITYLSFNTDAYDVWGPVCFHLNSQGFSGFVERISISLTDEGNDRVFIKIARNPIMQEPTDEPKDRNQYVTRWMKFIQLVMIFLIILMSADLFVNDGTFFGGLIAQWFGIETPAAEVSHDTLVVEFVEATTTPTAVQTLAPTDILNLNGAKATRHTQPTATAIAPYCRPVSHPGGVWNATVYYMSSYFEGLTAQCQWAGEDGGYGFDADWGLYRPVIDYRDTLGFSIIMSRTVAITETSILSANIVSNDDGAELRVSKIGDSWTDSLVLNPAFTGRTDTMTLVPGTYLVEIDFVEFGGLAHIDIDIQIDPVAKAPATEVEPTATPQPAPAALSAPAPAQPSVGYDGYTLTTGFSKVDWGNEMSFRVYLSDDTHQNWWVNGTNITIVLKDDAGNTHPLSAPAQFDGYATSFYQLADESWLPAGTYSWCAEWRTTEGGMIQEACSDRQVTVTYNSAPIAVQEKPTIEP